MIRLPVLLLAALPLAARSQDPAADPCDSSLAEKATANPSGYAPREGGKGDPRCEGTFTIPVRFRAPDMEVVSCVALWRNPAPGQEVVELCWERQAQAVRLRAQGRSEEERYQMDALGRAAAAAGDGPEHGHFAWDQTVLRGCELELPRIGVVAWTHVPRVEPAPGLPGTAGRNVLHPLVVNGPFAVPRATVDALGGLAQVTLLVRCSEETVDYEFDALWTSADVGVEATVDEDAAHRLLIVEGLLPADGEVWTLRLFASDGEDEVSFPNIHVMVPTWGFLRWAMGDDEP